MCVPNRKAEETLVTLTDGNVQVGVLAVYGGQEIPLMKRGHHRVNGFNLEPV